jgi:hypothetical protein
LLQQPEVPLGACAAVGSRNICKLRPRSTKSLRIVLHKQAVATLAACGAPWHGRCKLYDAMTELKPYTEPDRIARKLFIFTVCGACAFATIITLMMHVSNAELALEGSPSTPIVQLARGK